MLILNQFSGFGGAIPPLRAEVCGWDASTADGASYTFSSVNIGTPTVGRRVLVGVALQDNGFAQTITSATIGGNAASVLNQIGPTTQASAAFLLLRVDTGTTADIVINGAANAFQDCVIQVYALQDLISETPTDTGGATGTTGTTLSDTLDVAPGGAIFAVVGWRDTVQTDTAWTGVNEDVDGPFQNPFTASFAHQVFPTAEAGRTIQAAGSQAPLTSALSIISFR